MKKIHVHPLLIGSVILGLASSLSAMPTEADQKAEASKVLETIKKGSKKDNLADARFAFKQAEQSTSEGAKFLFYKGAFGLALEARDFEFAAEILNTMRLEITDMPETLIRSFIDNALSLTAVGQGQAFKDMKEALDTGAPYVLRITPRNGDLKVDPKTDKIVIYFDQPMEDGFSFPSNPRLPQPEWDGRPQWDKSYRVITRSIKSLKPCTYYRFHLNNSPYTNLRSRTSGTPLKSISYMIKTSGEPETVTSFDKSDKATAYTVLRDEERRKYGDETARKIEGIYQACRRARTMEERKELLQKLLDGYPEANRTGCAVLDVGIKLPGEEGEKYLKMAIEKYPNSIFGSCVVVGAFARYHLQKRYKASNRLEEAQKLCEEIKAMYPDAVMGDGKTKLVSVLDK